MKNDNATTAIFAALVLLAIAVTVGCRWYTSAMQAEVYRREGIEMTTWEVFCGAKPAERSIRIQESQAMKPFILAVLVMFAVAAKSQATGLRFFTFTQPSQVVGLGTPCGTVDAVPVRSFFTPGVFSSPLFLNAGVAVGVDPVVAVRARRALFVRAPFVRFPRLLRRW